MSKCSLLLEETPLKHLRALVRIRRQVRNAIAQVRQDRVRLPERTAVIEHERRDPEAGVELAPNLSAVGAIDDRYVDRLVFEAKVAEEEPLADLAEQLRDASSLDTLLTEKQKDLLDERLTMPSHALP